MKAALGCGRRRTTQLTPAAAVLKSECNNVFIVQGNRAAAPYESFACKSKPVELAAVRAVGAEVPLMTSDCAFSFSERGRAAGAPLAEKPLKQGHGWVIPGPECLL